MVFIQFMLEIQIVFISLIYLLIEYLPDHFPRHFTCILCIQYNTFYTYLLTIYVYFSYSPTVVFLFFFLFLYQPHLSNCHRFVNSRFNKFAFDIEKKFRVETVSEIKCLFFSRFFFFQFAKVCNRNRNTFCVFLVLQLFYRITRLWQCIFFFIQFVTVTIVK